jgi:hypothetical protein
VATVLVDGRELDVKPARLGLLKVLLPAQRKREDAIAAKDDATMVHATAEILFAYLGHNEGITVAWLLEHAPVRPSQLILECMKAAGQEVAAAGEASGT